MVRGNAFSHHWVYGDTHPDSGAELRNRGRDKAKKKEKKIECPNCGILRVNNFKYNQCPLCGASVEIVKPG